MIDEILTGDRNLSVEKWADKKKLTPKFMKNLSLVMEEPDELPYLMENMRNMFPKIRSSGKKAVRNALLRVQAHCSLHSNSDPIIISKRLFVSQVLEKLFFGGNLLSDGIDDDDKGK